MKFLFLLFFASSSPIVLFLATVLYGGITTNDLKKTLSASGIYETISNNFIQTDYQAEKEYTVFSDFVKERFTAEYIQKKAETAIDDSAAWITGTSQKAPIVSFSEIKQDMLMDHPELLEALENVPSENALQSSDLSQTEQTRYIEQRVQISSFIDQDFTVELDRHLLGLKTVYGYLQIAFPVLVILLAGSLFLLFKMPDDIPSKFRWIGAALLSFSIVGYIAIYSQIYITTLISKIYILDQTEFLVSITPLITGIYELYMDKYLSYQNIANIITIVCGFICFVVSLLTRNLGAKKVKPLKVDPTYWKETSKKK